MRPDSTPRADTRGPLSWGADETRQHTTTRHRGIVKASPDDQLQLLDLQAQDSILQRLTHRRETLPELAEIDELESRIANLDDEIVTVETEDSDLGREQAKLETDIDVVRGRMTRDQQRLDAGQVGS